MLPFLPCRGGVGTSFPQLNPDLKLFEDPVRGETLLAVPALVPDLALLHAACSDPFGNVQFVGTGYADRLLWRAADRTLVQVEQIISNEEVRQKPERTAVLASVVLRARWGAHPFSSPGFYLEDRLHIAELVEAGRACTRRDDRGPIEAYLDRYVREPEDHIEYLERVGLRRLLSLDEYRYVTPTTKEVMAAFIAHDIVDGEENFVGTNLPVIRAGALLAHLHHGPNMRVMLAHTRTNLFHAPAMEHFEMLTDWRAGRWAEGYLNDNDIVLYQKTRRHAVFFVGALQVDPFGNTNLIGLGPDPRRPRLRGPGAIATTTNASYADRYCTFFSTSTRPGSLCPNATG